MGALNLAAMTREKKVEETYPAWHPSAARRRGCTTEVMLTPKSLAIMVTSLVGLAIAQAFGIGELIDALVLIAGLGFCGWGIVDGGRELFHSMRIGSP